ncbi:MAG: serine hydrolase domain-containing protein [Micropepsaceae bacterium]
MSAPQVHGFCEPRFAGARAAFAANFTSGADMGASFAATIDGEFVADLWGGFADAEGKRPWAEDTIINVYSTTKTMCALTALLCADRGLIDFAAPVAKYWPEFAAAGKDRITVAHLMSHSAGLSGFDQKVATEDLYDWEKITTLLARQAPWWEPGTRSGYHAITQGYLVGEVVRRVSGKTLGTLFREEIAGPLGADFHIGLPAQHDARVADLIPPAQSLGAVSSQSEIARRTFASTNLTAEEPKTTAWRRAEIPAAGGIGNARSVALIQSLLVNGGAVRGKRILSEAGVRRALELQIESDDMVLGVPVRFGLGYGLPSAVAPFPNPNTAFWGGWGGSLVVCDYDARMTFSYVMNRMNSTTTGDARVSGLFGGLYAGLMAAA